MIYSVQNNMILFVKSTYKWHQYDLMHVMWHHRTHNHCYEFCGLHLPAWPWQVACVLVQMAAEDTHYSRC